MTSLYLFSPPLLVYVRYFLYFATHGFAGAALRVSFFLFFTLVQCFAALYLNGAAVGIYQIIFFQRRSADRTGNCDDHAVHGKKVRGSRASSVFHRASVKWRCQPWHFILSFFSDEVQIGPETVMTTLYTAKKYAVPALEKHCVDFLKRNLSPDNAFMLLTQVSYYLFVTYFSVSACFWASWIRID
jgi:hypothetical protein